MKTYLDCYPCFLRQALQAARIVGADEDLQLRVLTKVMAEMLQLDRGQTPPEIGHRIHRIVRSMVDVVDPYSQIKSQCTRQALALYPRLKALVADAGDPLRCAVRLAIVGNVMDLAIEDFPTDRERLWQEVQRGLAEELAVDDVALLRQAVASARNILFLADNAGETVFDRVLIETMGRPVHYAVKGGPVLNDATRADAVEAGFDGHITLLDNGSDAPGTILVECSESFVRSFWRADLIIAKGQANYETLSDLTGRAICFLLKIKCPVIGRDAQVPVGGMVCRMTNLSARCSCGD